MRQICTALASPAFDGFPRAARPELAIATMTQYRADFPFPVAFPPQELRGVFSEVVSAQGLRQERMAETEKYAHVTFFFSGGQEAEVAGESRVLIPSPKVATYDLRPAMSAVGVTDALVRAIESDRYDVIVANFANPDMVGHTGIWDATVRALEVIDGCLARIVEAALAGMVLSLLPQVPFAEQAGFVAGRVERLGQRHFLERQLIHIIHRP